MIVIMAGGAAVGRMRFRILLRLASPRFGDRDWLGFKRLLGLASPRLASRWTRVDMQVIGLWYRILFSFCD